MMMWVFGQEETCGNLIGRKRGNLSSQRFVEVMYVEFGEKLRELRMQHNISQNQLAEKLKVTPRTVRGWEHEGRIPKQDWIYHSLSDLFACPLDTLMPEKQEPPPPSMLSAITSDVDAKRSLSATKTIFIEQRISLKEQQEFLIDLAQIYISATKKSS